VSALSKLQHCHSNKRQIIRDHEAAQIEESVVVGTQANQIIVGVWLQRVTDGDTSEVVPSVSADGLMLGL
jgi:hypothetical protein